MRLRIARARDVDFDRGSGGADLNSNKTLIIIPTYNERDNVSSLVEQIFAVVPEAHVLLVDDQSPDGTADYAEELFGTGGRLSVLRREGPRGLGCSYVDGYKRALDGGYTRVIQMDADFSHDPKYLPLLMSAANKADVVIGSRYCAGGSLSDWPLHRRLLSRFANFYVRAITGLAVEDSTSGFRCFSRYAIERIIANQIVSEGYAFQVEVAYRAHEADLKIVEVPIVFTDRREGKSKISRAVIWESALLPWRLRFTHEPEPNQYTLPD